MSDLSNRREAVDISPASGAVVYGPFLVRITTDDPEELRRIALDFGRRWVLGTRAKAKA